MKRNIILIFLFISCSTKPPRKVDSQFVSEEIGFASSKASSVIIVDHKYFKIAYDQDKRLAKYVVYSLRAQDLKLKIATRKNKFISDPKLVKDGIPHVLPSEYLRTGYDRGHLAPSADFAWSQEANDLTFVMSNMVPQTPSLNRDSWKRLEDKVRKWGCGEGNVTVITGPILKDGLSKLKGGLNIPQEFFKIIIDETPPKKVISFIYHQDDGGDLLEKRIVPYQTIENHGVAFLEHFPELKKTRMRMPAKLNEWKEKDCFKSNF